MPNVWCVMGACDVVICVVCLWCCDVGTKLFISSSRSLIDILTQFHTGHYQCELGGTTGYTGTWAESWTGDMRHQWHPSEWLDWRQAPGDIHLNAGLSSESESPSCTDHTRPPLSSQCVQHSNFRREGGGGVSKGCGERAIVVTFFSNKNCIIAEWAGAALRRGNEGSLWETWTGFVARRKTLLMCWLKTSPQNSAGKTYSKSIYHEERSSVFV